MMKKLGLFLLLLTLLVLWGCGNKGELSEIDLVVDKTEVEIGETVQLSFIPTPDIPETAPGGKAYRAKCIEYFVRIDGVDTRIARQQETASYVIKSGGEYIFWAKYCDHNSHTDTENDIVSNTVTVKTITHPISSAEELKARAALIS